MTFSASARTLCLRRTWILSFFCATMSLSLLSNTYLEEISNKIRAKPVPWEVRAAASHRRIDP
jgi:hypothetical protein